MAARVETACQIVEDRADDRESIGVRQQRVEPARALGEALVQGRREPLRQRRRIHDRRHRQHACEAREQRAVAAEVHDFVERQALIQEVGGLLDDGQRRGDGLCAALQARVIARRRRCGFSHKRQRQRRQRRISGAFVVAAAVTGGGHGRGGGGGRQHGRRVARVGRRAPAPALLRRGRHHELPGGVVNAREERRVVREPRCAAWLHRVRARERAANAAGDGGRHGSEVHVRNRVWRRRGRRRRARVVPAAADHARVVVGAARA
mmetsp:Transcript_5083/g.16107  ORF Transcript_5083/g.16107 Transcript_5083/m.16107 type:complete len:264 (+) Transcript_5083:1589-2380(+)